MPVAFHEFEDLPGLAAKLRIGVILGDLAEGGVVGAGLLRALEN